MSRRPNQTKCLLLVTAHDVFHRIAHSSSRHSGNVIRLRANYRILFNVPTTLFRECPHGFDVVRAVYAPQAVVRNLDP